jgi:hypothetical protein
MENIPNYKMCDKTHRELKDKYDHYPCIICMNIGIQEYLEYIVIKDLQAIYEGNEIYPNGENMLLDIKELLEKYKKVGGK